MARRPYERTVSPTTWWLKDPHFNRRLYADYMASELTSVFIAIYMVLFVWGLGALARGPEAYAAFMGVWQHPAGAVAQVVILLFALYHSVTWFQLAPKGMKPLKVRGKKVPDQVVIQVQYAVWAGFTAFAIIVVWML